MDGLLQPTGDSPLQTGTTPPIVVAGHSHMCALVGDRFVTEPEMHAVSDFPNLFALHAPWPRREDYWGHLREKGAGTRIALVWGGNEHNVHYFFESKRPFDFWSRHVSKLSSTFHLMSQRRVRHKFMESSLGQLDTVLANLASGTATSISVIGTPPPKRDSEGLRKILLNEPLFVQFATQIGETIDTAKITPPHIRLKLWFLLQDMLAEAARRVGAIFIPVPETLRDEDGFLPYEYWASDVTHANRLYGQVMLRRIVEELGQTQ
jgi:hypothetical protein